MFSMQGSQKIFLHGGGEHAKVVIDCLQAQGMNVVAIFDPKLKGELFGVPMGGRYDPKYDAGALAVVAIGENKVRKNAVSVMTHAFANAIHPSSLISHYAVIGTGNMILHRTIIQAETRLGNHVIVNTGGNIDHDCVIDDFAHIGPGAILCGTVKVGEGALIGAGSIVIPGKKIGSWATVGAGAVVTSDIPDHAVAVGNPARIIKYNNR
jgi:sugar O-acyltransferase (sialic acid O-acetyltransferase NeuD family)